MTNGNGHHGQRERSSWPTGVVIMTVRYDSLSGRYDSLFVQCYSLAVRYYSVAVRDESAV
jgi:hypothetical protein